MGAGLECHLSAPLSTACNEFSPAAETSDKAFRIFLADNSENDDVSPFNAVKNPVLIHTKSIKSRLGSLEFFDQLSSGKRIVFKYIQFMQSMGRYLVFKPVQIPGCPR